MEMDWACKSKTVFYVQYESFQSESHPTILSMKFGFAVEPDSTSELCLLCASGVFSKKKY